MADSTRKNLTKILTVAVIALVALQPVFDLDYLLYDWLDQVGLPRLSTLIRFVCIPLLIVLTFFLKDKNKKRTLLLGGLYGVALGAYFYFHCRQAQALYPILGFTTNFYFSVYQELVYLLTLVLPFGIIYCVYHCHFDSTIFKKIVYTLSGIMGIPILLGDLFVFGKSTYYGYTVANLFSWFGGIYEAYHPRTLASKFFFNEGNTIGILMFMILPLMYYFFSQAKNKKERIGVGILIGIQSLSMQILATRVATYGAVVIPAIFLVLYLFDQFVLKHGKIQKTVCILCVVFSALFAAILPFTPAIKNQQVDAVNDLALIENGAVDEGKAALANGKDLMPGTVEYNNFYIFMFEQYGIRARYATSIPSMYYKDWYSYKYDPKFWVDMIMDRPVDERVSGRQIQKIFMDYKLAKCSSTQRLLGMGYSTFMNGSILLEQDFIQQIYTLGYVGTFLAMGPWILLVAVGGVLVLLKAKKLFNLEVLTLAMALCCGLGSGYISGHTLDQFVTTTFMALLVGILLNRIVAAYQKSE